MNQKIHNIIYWLFVIESIVILIGITCGRVTYGIDVQTPFMALGIIAGLILVSIPRWVLNKLSSPLKDTLQILLSLIMVFLCLYYVLEDKFEII